MKTYKGSCHCGTISYTVTGDFTTGLKCNCSHCKRKGLLLTFVPDTQFCLLTGAEKQTTYKFNKRQIDHIFCQICGVQSYAHGHDGNNNFMTAINLTCLENFNINDLIIQEVDGASL